MLAAVLISISGLFVLAHRQVDGGRKHSVALSVARDILEEMDGWSFRQIYLEYGLDGSAASYTIDSRTNTAAAGWQDALSAELSECHAEILLQSLDGGCDHECRPNSDQWSDSFHALTTTAETAGETNCPIPVCWRDPWHHSTRSRKMPKVTIPLPVTRREDRIEYTCDNHTGHRRRSADARRCRVGDRQSAQHAGGGDVSGGGEPCRSIGERHHRGSVRPHRPWAL